MLGGIGLGLGYISPVSTLIKWFPDRPGMATGMAIMGFGGGALIGSPLSVCSCSISRRPPRWAWPRPSSVMGVIYFVLHDVRRGDRPRAAAGLDARRLRPPAQPRQLVTTATCTSTQAMKTPQFWLLWVVLCLNVTAGIGVLGQASPMIQEMFPGRVSAAAAAGFVGLLSLFNMVGRFFWASTLRLHRPARATYMIFFAARAWRSTASVPTTGHAGEHGPLRGWSTASSSRCTAAASRPSRPISRDIFGTRYVGAIHGRLLTAWSAAGVLGPVLVNYIREYQIDHGVAKADAYTSPCT